MGSQRGRLVRVPAGIAAAGVLGFVGLWLWPSPIDPVAWEPPKPPALEGAFAPNEDLRSADLLATGQIHGAEDVDVDDDGRVYASSHGGKVVRIDVDGTVEDFALTQGRPLGMHWDPDGNLVVCDAFKGLLRIDASGVVEVLATEAGEHPFGFTNDVDVASDGTIYFSDASWKWPQTHYMHELMEGRPYGRLLRHDPESGNTEVLLEDLYFANGVALSKDEDFVLVHETYRFRTIKYWLKGPQAGTSEVFAENLPGYPDGLARDEDGNFWMAMFTVRNPAARFLAPRPDLRDLVVKLPEFTWPKPKQYGLIIAFDPEGAPIRSLHDPSGEHITLVTAVQPHGDKLYLGTLDGDRIGVVTP
jgi:sugar lactone lactonase YvrE